MKVKFYEAATEAEAIEKVKAELGGGAVILNIKKTQPKGIFKLLRKAKVEVVAAYDEVHTQDAPEIAGKPAATGSPLDDEGWHALLGSFMNKDKAPKEAEESSKEAELADLAEPPQQGNMETGDEQQSKLKNLEKILASNEAVLGNILTKLSVTKTQETLVNPVDRKYDSTVLQLFYDELIKNDVSDEVAQHLLRDVNISVEDDPSNLNRIIKIVYNRIVAVLKQPEPILIDQADLPQVVVFIGPTGVGKTTTIAKLSSQLILQNSMRVGMITADTYRIAAIDQLRTYAEILGVDLEVVYNPEDLEASYQKIKPLNDIIFIDTAGRSHKNMENFLELQALLEKVPQAKRYLVLSATTKQNDLNRMIEIFSQLGDYRIIFTKLDETMTLGSIINVCYQSGSGLSYITDGQNVPDDIKIAKPELIAKALLGSFDK